MQTDYQYVCLEGVCPEVELQINKLRSEAWDILTLAITQGVNGNIVWGVILRREGTKLKKTIRVL